VIGTGLARALRVPLDAPGVDPLHADQFTGCIPKRDQQQLAGNADAMGLYRLAD